jgi:acetone carboxylase gamma subunit
MKKRKIIRNYICKECGDILHEEDVIKHIVADHDADWRGSFEDARDWYELSLSIRRVKDLE